MPLQRAAGPMFEDGSLTQSKFTPGTITWTSNASLSASTVIADNSRVLELTAADVTYTGAMYTNYITGPNESAGLSLSANNSGTINYVIDRFRFTLDAAVMIPMINTARVVYQYTGSDQTFVVPAGITCIFAKMWGGGGGTGIPGGWNYGAEGAGGGFSQGIIPVVPGETLTLVVGRGGTTCNTSTPIYGGGGLPGGGTDQRYAGTGGGLAGIFRGGFTAANALIIAGGGGGGGSSRAWHSNVGGAGGGVEGVVGCAPFPDAGNTTYSYGGGGGTQTAGGTSTNGTAGTQLQGGRGHSNAYGGGGGGGWWGGGGGSYAEDDTMSGGGGGSGYIHSSVVLGGTFAGAGRMPAFFWDPDLNPSTRQGGATIPGYGGVYNHTGQGAQGFTPLNGTGGIKQSGGHGKIVIYY